MRGWRVDSGWGSALGYPGLRPDPAGPEVAVELFESDDLPAHWSRLDAFEGDAYERVIIGVHVGGEVMSAQIYALRPEP